MRCEITWMKLPKGTRTVYLADAVTKMHHHGGDNKKPTKLVYSEALESNISKYQCMQAWMSLDLGFFADVIHAQMDWVMVLYPRIWPHIHSHYSMYFDVLECLFLWYDRSSIIWLFTFVIKYLWLLFLTHYVFANKSYCKWLFFRVVACSITLDSFMSLVLLHVKTISNNY